MTWNHMNVRFAKWDAGYWTAERMGSGAAHKYLDANPAAKESSTKAL